MAVYTPKKESVALWRVRAVLLALFPSFICGVLWDFGSRAYILGTIVWLAVLGMVCWIYIPLRYKTCAYTLEEERITCGAGVFFRQVKTIQLNSVQYATLLRMPLQRLFGTATVIVHGAGGRLLLQDVDLQTGHMLVRRLTGKR